MAFWTALKGIFGGSKLDIGQTFSTVAKGINNLALTKQEAADSTSEFVKDTLSENTERSKTRRFIAKAIVVNHLLLFWLCLALMYKGISIDNILSLAAEFKMGIAFLMVLAFFFGGYYLTQSTKKTKK